MTLSWFKTPRADDPGTLNLSYNAIDLPVIRGLAAEPAVLGPEPLDFAGLLELVGALGGAFRGLGVQVEDTVGAALDDPRTELLVFLAAARVGAVYADLTSGGPGLSGLRPHLVVSDRLLDLTGHAPASLVLVGIDPVDETRDLAWEVAIKAGRTDPAGCEPVAVGTTAYVLEAPVALTVEPAPDRLGSIITTLSAGKPVDLSPGAVR